MRAFVRSLKYASFRAGRVIGISILMSVGFVFYFAFLSGEPWTLSNILSRLPLMLIFIPNLMFLLYGMVDVASYVPLTLSYGCTRQHAFFSNIYMQILQIFSMEGLLLLCVKCIPGTYLQVNTDGALLCAISLCLFLFGSGVSLPCGVLISKYGKTAYMIIVIITAVCGGIGGALMGFREVSSGLSEWLGIYINIPVVLGAGIIWYVLMNIIFYFGIRKFEVRV